MGAEICYLGHGSLRMKTSAGFVVYVDPYAGDGYDVPADLILVTHQHHDHNNTDLPAKKPGCAVRQNYDFLKDGAYLAESFGGVRVQAVQAYNGHHPKSECVGYILEFDSLKIYVAGDTSRTEQMESMAELGLDFAFLPIDGIFNMGPDEAAVCAELIGAKHVIPYHTAPGRLFSRRKAEKFVSPARVIMEPGETLSLDV